MTPNQILKQYFGFDDFRYPQGEIIKEILNGKNTLAIMPTGSGKSLCYQIPAIIFDGLTIVVSPLISLMKDQIDTLNAKGINAVSINSQNTKKQNDRNFEAINKWNIKLLYISPERIQNDGFMNYIRQKRISLVAVDEAHCCSIWGNNFRPDYAKIATLLEVFPDVPVIALTATANSAITEDIKRILCFDPQIYKMSFDRPNISLEIISKGYAEGNVKRLLDETFGNGKKGSVIIYCYSKKDCAELSYHINQMTAYKSDFYHAGLNKRERIETQEKFSSGEIPIVVATIAFGMGIDKSDVRLIIHHTIPKSIEGYYQEIGRAGRDGLPARAVLLYSYHDIKKVEFLIKKTNQKEELDRLQKMVSFCTTIQCRRQMLLAHFEEEHSGYCGSCDVCGN